MIVCVEGLIGVGKSTVCESLVNEGCIGFFEPVEDNPFLKDYYADSKRWAYTMQVNLLVKRFEMFQRAQWTCGHSEVAVMDRSYFGDYAFAIVQKRFGLMDDREFNSYRDMHRLHQHWLGFPDLIIRLVLPLEAEQDRIKSRGRGCEKGIDPAYLMALDEAYNDLFEELDHECTVIEVDATQSKEKVLEDVKAAIARVQCSDACISEKYPHYKRF